MLYYIIFFIYIYINNSKHLRRTLIYPTSLNNIVYTGNITCMLRYYNYQYTISRY